MGEAGEGDDAFDAVSGSASTANGEAAPVLTATNLDLRLGTAALGGGAGDGLNAGWGGDNGGGTFSLSGCARTLIPS